jgi:hypothetical protein
MRCLIDGDIKTSRNHPDTIGVGDGKTRYTQALVLNRDDVPGWAVPIGWTYNWDRNGEPNGEHRWTIQGNDNATWFVEGEL